jgi:hypothetical protein
MSAVRFIWSADRDGVQLLAGAKLGRIEGYRWNPDPRGYRLGSRPFAANSQFAAGAHGNADQPTRMCGPPGIPWSLAAGRITAKMYRLLRQ